MEIMEWGFSAVSSQLKHHSEELTVDTRPEASEDELLQ